MQSIKDAKKRPQFFKLNVDAAKAFDSVLRHRVIEILEHKKVTQQLINAIANTLEDTAMEIDGVKVQTHIGLP